MQSIRSNEVEATGRLIERQMLLARFRQANAGETAATGERYRFITISRDLGAQGNLVASELAARLGWRIYDKEIVDYIAANSNVHKDLVRELDERAQNLVHDTVDRLLRMAEGVSFGNEEYHKALLKTLASFAALGGVIIVGRGGAYALQGQPGLHLRITASPDVRVGRIRERHGITLEEARRRVQRVDAERRSFLHHHFKASPENENYYDLIINTDRMSALQAAEAVLGMMQERPLPAPEPEAAPSPAPIPPGFQSRPNEARRPGTKSAGWGQSMHS